MPEQRSQRAEPDASKQPAPQNTPDRDDVLDVEREANKRQPKNFKEKAVTDKVIDLGPVDPKDSNIKDLDPPR